MASQGPCRLAAHLHFRRRGPLHTRRDRGNRTSGEYGALPAQAGAALLFSGQGSIPVLVRPFLRETGQKHPEALSDPTGWLYSAHRTFLRVRAAVPSDERRAAGMLLGLRGNARLAASSAICENAPADERGCDKGVRLCAR